MVFKSIVLLRKSLYKLHLAIFIDWRRASIRVKLYLLVLEADVHCQEYHFIEKIFFGAKQQMDDEDFPEKIIS